MNDMQRELYLTIKAFADATANMAPYELQNATHVTRSRYFLRQALEIIEALDTAKAPNQPKLPL
jgi:hypothetical protein